MYKVLLCDDEPKIIQLLINLIDWESLDLSLAGTAYNGFDALSMIQQTSPDIVMTDISMPGLDGIELIEKATTINPEMRFIIFSGYKEFDYAQRAIKLGVEDYLLKPIYEDELQHILQSTIQKIRQKQGLIQLESKLSNNLSKLRSQVLPTILNSVQLPDPETLKQVYDTEFPHEAFQVCLLRVIMTTKKDDSDNNSFLLQKDRQVAERFFSEQFDSIYYATRPEGIYILINASRQKFSDAPGLYKTLIRNLRLANEAFSDTQITLGASTVCTDYFQLKELISEAEAAAFESFYNQCPSLISFDALVIKDRTHAALPALTTKFFNAVEYAALDSLNEILDTYYTHLKATPHSGYQAYHYCLDLYAMFISAARKSNYPVVYCNIRDFTTIALRQSRFQDLFELLREKMANAVTEYRQQLSNQACAPILKIQNYLDVHYPEPVTLQDLGKVFGFHPVYLSRLFKQETGKNFKDYLFELRMCKATEFLQDSNTDISDIGMLVGYSDEKHFVKLFKQYAGISPKEYRKLYQITF